MNRPPKDFDLSTSPIPGADYIPPKARSRDEIERRKSLLPGELILEQQQKGLRIGRMTLGALTDRESLDFALPLVNLSALNSVWYLYAEPERQLNDSIRRRRLKLPLMKDYQDRDHMFESYKYALAQGEKLSARLTEAFGTGTNGYERLKRDFSTCVGNAALLGAAVHGLADGPIPGTPLRAQDFAREQAFRLLESRAEAAERLGSVPTLAQMADGYSDVSVWWQRKAPDAALHAYRQAQSDSLADI